MIVPHEIPFSDRSANPFTRSAQERDRALLPEPVQALLRELFEKRDQHAKDEARIGAEIEKAMTEGATAVAEPRPSMGRGRALGRLRIAVENLLAQLHEDDRTIGIDIWKTVRAAREALDAIPPIAGPVAPVAEPRSERDAAIVAQAERVVGYWIEDDESRPGIIGRELAALARAVDLPKGAPLERSDSQHQAQDRIRVLESKLGTDLINKTTRDLRESISRESELKDRIRTLESNLDQAVTALEQSAQRVADMSVDYDRGRRDGWERMRDVAANECIRPSVNWHEEITAKQCAERVRALPYEPAPAKSEKQEGATS